MFAIEGAIAGVISFSILVGALDSAFRPYPDDMQMWLLYSIPAGAVFGTVSGAILGLATKRKLEAAGGVAIASSLMLGVFHLMLLPDAIQRLNSSPSTRAATTAYAYAQYGPGLLWSVLLLVFGLHCFYQGSKTNSTG